MTVLEKIDKRLTLWPEWYLDKLMSMPVYDAYDLHRYFKQSGIMYIRQPKRDMTFDEWLVGNGMGELVI